MVAMDIQTLLIGIVICLILALLVWGFTSFMVRERPFEERLEQQRRMEHELLQLDSKHPAHGLKKDKLKKKSKKNAKAGERDNISPVSALPEKSDDGGKAKSSKMVELEIEPEVIETSPDEPPSAASKKKKASKVSPPVVSTKPILINKEEKIALRKSDEAPEVVHRRNVPKDVVELKHERERAKADAGAHEQVGVNGFSTDHKRSQVHSHATAAHTSTDKSKSSGVEQVSVSEDVKTNSAAASGRSKKQQQLVNGETNNDAVTKMQVTNVSAIPPSVAEPVTEQTAKKKAKAVDVGFSGGSLARSTEVDNLFELVQTVPLSETDVRRFIDVLCVKLPSDDTSLRAEYNKKGQKDPLLALQKQLDDKKKEIDEEKIRSRTANEKAAELQLELADLRSKMTLLVKQNSDQIASQRQENATLSSRLQQQEAASNSLRVQMETLKSQLAESRAELQRTQSDNLHLVNSAQQMAKSEAELRQKVMILDDALKASTMSMNQTDNSKRTLEIKIKQYEERIGHFEATMADSQMYASRLKETTDELQEAKKRIQSLTLEHEKQILVKTDELKSLENEVHDIGRLKGEVEGRLRLADAEVVELTNKNHRKDAEIQNLKSQLQHLTEELNKEKSARQAESVGEELLQKVDLLGTESSLPGTGWSEVSELSDRLDVALNEASEAHKETENLRQQLAHSRAKYDEVTLNLSNLNSQLETERVAAQKGLFEKDAKIAEVEAQLHKIQSDLTDVESRLKHKDVEATQIEARLHEKEAEYVQLENRLQQSASGDGEPSSHHDAAGHHQLAELQAKLQQREVEFAAVESQLQQKEVEFANVESRLQEKQAECIEIESKLRQLETAAPKGSSDGGSQFQQMEAEVAELRHQLSQVTNEKSDAESRLHQKEVGFSDIEAQLHQKMAECADIEARLHQKEADFAELEKRLQETEAGSRKDAENSDLETHLHKKEAECEALESRLIQKESECADFEMQLQQKAAEFAELDGKLNQKELERAGIEARLQEKERQLEVADDKLKSQNSDHEVIDAKLAESLSTIEALRCSSSEHLEAKLEQHTVEVSKLQAELEQLRVVNASLQATIDDMRSELGKATTEDVNGLRARLESQDAEICKLDTALQEAGKTQRQIQVTLNKIFPDLQLEADCQDHSSWLLRLETQLSEFVQGKYSASSSASEEQFQVKLDEAKETEKKLLFQVQHYQTVLSDTESILKQLQETVEMEEQKNLLKLQAAEQQLNTVKCELQSLKKDMAGMHKNSECFACVVETPAVDHTEHRESSVEKKQCVVSSDTDLYAEVDQNTSCIEADSSV